MRCGVCRSRGLLSLRGQSACVHQLVAVEMTLNERVMSHDPKSHDPLTVRGRVGGVMLNMFP